ncbi:hypothetical protein HC928_10950 [bacterium]|nr:hypothetical protein [bacterium]
MATEHIYIEKDKYDRLLKRLTEFESALEPDETPAAAGVTSLSSPGAASSDEPPNFATERNNAVHHRQSSREVEHISGIGNSTDMPSHASNSSIITSTPGSRVKRVKKANGTHLGRVHHTSGRVKEKKITKNKIKEKLFPPGKLALKSRTKKRPGSQGVSKRLVEEWRKL